MKKVGVFEWSMRYNKIVLLVVIMLMCFGIYALKVIPKQEYPVFTIRQGLVVGIYPGASAKDVEEKLSKPLERFLLTYKEIDKEKTYSISKEGISYIRVELNEFVSDKDEVWNKIKHGLSDFKATLPMGVLSVFAQDDFGDTSALLITIQSEDKTYRELQDYLVDLEDRLRRIEALSNLRRYGLQKEEISVYVDKEKLALYNIDNRMLFHSIAAQGLTTGMAQIDNDNYDVPIHFEHNFLSEKEIGEHIVSVDEKGNVIRLKDVARIVREYEEPDNIITNNGKKTILLSMEMREGENIVKFGEDVDKVLNEFQKTIPKSVSIERIADQPKVVRDSVTSFLRDLFLAIIIVILAMMILFPFRSALVAAVTIPVSVFVSIAIMYVFKIPLNTVTLAGLIVVLGMIVDNAIVVIDAYLEYVDKGHSRWNAAIMSAKNYFGSLLLATFCICIIFFPLLETFPGEYLDFILFFPWTITISLMTSLIIAVLLIPFLEFTLIKKGLHAKDKTGEKKKGINLLNFVQKGYDKILGYAFKAPILTILIGIGSILASILIFKGVPTRMMPTADREQFAVEIYLPQGSPFSETKFVCDSLQRILMRDERVKSVTSFVGMGSPRFQATYEPNLKAKNYGQFIVNTQSIKATIDILDEYSEKYADFFPNAYVRFKQLDYQIVQCPVEVRFFGDDISVLRKLSDSLVCEMRKLPMSVWVHDNYEGTLPALNVKIDPIDSKRLGISRLDVETEISMRTKGMAFGSLWEGDYKLPIKILPELYGKKQNFLTIGDEYISSVIPGIKVPLRQIAKVEPDWDNSEIVRRNGMLCVSVFSNIKRHYNANELQKATEKIIKEKFSKLPEGVTINYGGAKEKDDRVIPGIVSGIAIAIVIIFFFMLFNFKKVSLAFSALSSLMLCAFGAVLGVLIFGFDFGITCILGVVSLMGGIVRNVIIMFQHADDLRSIKHFKAKDAAFDAGKRRMMPIFLTSSTTAVGVIPMITAGSSLWAPMGAVIFIGTICAMTLTLFVMPVVYWKIYGNK